MSLLLFLSENLDALTPPALPSDWSAEGVWQSSAAQQVSAPNGLKLHEVSVRRTFHYAAAQDGNGGDALVRAKFRFVTGCGAASEACLFLRASAPETYAGIVCYMARITVGTNLALFYRSGGSNTQLGSPVTVAFALDRWYELHFQAQGDQLQAKVQDLSNSLWLANDGAWQSAETVCLTANDGALTGQGYLGLIGRNSNTGAGADNKLFADDLLAHLLVPDPPDEDGSGWRSLLRPPRRPSKRRAKRRERAQGRRGERVTKARRDSGDSNA